MVCLPVAGHLARHSVILREHANPWGKSRSPGRQSGKPLARGSKGSGGGAETGVAGEAGCGVGAQGGEAALKGGFERRCWG